MADDTSTPPPSESTAAAKPAGSWLPLESNPEVLNPFVHRLGLPADWNFHDVFGLDEELLMMVPQPCVALCLLYPSEGISAPRRADQAKVRKDQPPVPDGLFFTMQPDGIGNACGTIACIHAVANGVKELNQGPLTSFMQGTAAMDHAQRGLALLQAKDMQELSDQTATAGTTEGAGTDDAQDQHFICFVRCGDLLYECDGRNFDKTEGGAVAMPFCHGATSEETFLSDAAKIIRKDVMERKPDCINFNITALCQASMD